MSDTSTAVEELQPPVVACVIRSGRVASVSAASVQVSGLPPEQFLGRLAWDVVHPDDRPLIARYFAVGWTGEIDVALRLKDSDGAWTWRLVRGARGVDERGEPTAQVTLTKVEWNDSRK